MKRLLLLAFLTWFISSANGQLTYKYYEGNWSALPNFGSLSASKTGTTSNVDLGVANRGTQYAIQWTGKITLPTAANYTFDTYSDDGSKLYMGSSLVVNNDGSHAPQTATGTIYLNPGTYDITILYFQGGGGQNMEVYYSSSAGISRQRIPDAAFSGGSTTPSIPAAPASGSGLNYSYYEGTWSALPDFNSMTPVKSGTASNIDLNVRNRDNQYGIKWTGKITLPTNGAYAFDTWSDDGSKLFLGSTLVVNNDGAHSPQTATGTIYLNAGTYDLTALYFQNGGGQNMEVFWSCPQAGISRQKIPDAAFSGGTTTTPTTPTTPATGSGINYSYYEGTWGALPDFNSLNPVKSGTASNIDLNVRNRDNQYGIKWTGKITLPANGAYAFDTWSDDGSKLFLGSTLVVNNDGAHGPQTATGTIYLNAGTYDLTALYFQNSGGQNMEVFWSCPQAGISRQRIPDAAFTGGTGTTVPVTPDPTPTPTPIPTAPSTPADEGSGGLTGSTSYYFSSTSGDDSRSSAQAQNPSTPWRTLNKLNSYFANLKGGDAILFKRGETFEGNINIIRSGSAGNPIIFSAYGSGDKPVITGFNNVGNWSNVGGGVYEGSLQGGSKVNVVAINGAPQVLGRYPNATDANKGYLSYESHNGTSQITDNQLPYIADWVGGEVAIRKNRWVIDRGVITGYSGNTISYRAPTNVTPTDGYGYFIQNHPRTLDQFGEWYYDPSSKRLKVFFGSNNPNNYDVKGSVTDIVVSSNGSSNITFDNLTISGANTNAFLINSGANNFRIANCNIINSGMNAINANYVSNLILENSNVNNTNNDALYIAPYCSNAIIRNNVINNTGVMPGMAKGDNDCHQAITIQGSYNQVTNNQITNTGYAAIKFLGDNCLIKNNFINQFCVTVDDGGGIYTSGENNQANRQIIGNIVLNGRGVHEGTTQSEDLAANGIYLDDKTANVILADNTVANCSENGIYIHNSHEITVTNNTVFNGSRGQLSIGDDILEPNDQIRNVNTSNNVLCAKRPNQLAMWLHTNQTVNPVGIAGFGSFNNNYYFRPLDDNKIIGTLQTNPWFDLTFNLQEWKNRYGKDGNSSKSPMTYSSSSNPDDNLRLEYNSSTSDQTISLGDTYMDAKRNTYNGSITLAPFTSAILMKVNSGTRVNSTELREAATVAAESTSASNAAMGAATAVTLSLSPNPATEKIRLAITSPESNEKSTVTIHSISGVLMKSATLTAVNQTLNVDVASWSKGVYIVRYANKGKVITQQFVKQ